MRSAGRCEARGPRRGVCLTAAGLLILAGCRSGEAPSDPVTDERNTLIVALSSDVDSWNPYTTREAASAGILDMLYPRLVVETGKPDGGSSFEPWLAERWEFSSDRLALTFHLRPRAVWSDGSPVTCRDVQFTYGAQVSEALAWPGAFVKGRIESIECPGEKTAVFRFNEASADQLLDANDNAIVPTVYAEVPFDRWASTSWEDRIVTCGPYRLAAVRPGQEAILERDPTWWAAAATGIERIVLRVYPEATGVLPRLIDGDVDLVLKVPPLQASEVERRSDLELQELPSLAYTYIGWNVLEPGAYAEDRRARGCEAGQSCEEGPSDILRLQKERPHAVLAEPAVRRALGMAIDREDIVSGVWAGHARPGTSPVVSALWAHVPGLSVPFDPQGAGALLDGAGWRDTDGDGVRDKGRRKMELSVIVNSENRVRRDVLDRVVWSLSRLGVRLLPEPLPRAEFVKRARDKDFDAVLSGWWAGTRVQPQNLLHTKAAVNRGNNFGSWSTPSSDRLLDRGAVATTREAALPFWRQWQEEFQAQQPIAVLYEENRLLGSNRRTVGPVPSYLNPFQDLYRRRPSHGSRDGF